MTSTEIIIYALLGGILPALVWLTFWLLEDAKRPEPRGLILKSFLLGMLTVVLVIPFQRVVEVSFPGAVLLAYLLWSALEEAFKLGAAYFGGLNSKEDNEPIDPLIYMITAALGFTALENALFIANPLVQADLLGSLVTGHLRFIGASVLHVVSSAIIGVALGLTFYKPHRVKILWGSVALILASLFHTGFNILLIHKSQISNPLAFTIIWVSVAAVLLMFEKVKTIKPSLSTTGPSQYSDSRDTI